MATGTADFPGRPFRLRIETWYNWQTGTQASQHVEVWVDKLSYSPSWSGCCSSYNVYLGNLGNIGSWSGGFDFQNGNNFLIFAADRQVTVNGNGDSGAWVDACYDQLGCAGCGATHDGTPPAPPSRMAQPTSSNPQPTQITLNWTAPSDNGTAIDAYLLRRYPSLAAIQSDTGYTDYPKGSGDRSHTPTGLTPGTTYYWVTYAHNSNGYSTQSPYLAVATAPSVAPDLTVTPTPSGTGVALTFGPPGGITPTTYTYDVKRVSTGEIVTDDEATNPDAAVGLAPGEVYEWRAAAYFGTGVSAYKTPYSTWQAVQQPNPNTNPGTFFDGSTVDTLDVDYAWTGTAHASTSTATGVSPAGWSVTGTGGASVVQRVTGGHTGTYAARVTVQTTQTNVRAGMRPLDPFFADVEVGATYFGSVWVWAPTALALTPEIGWYTAAGVFVSRTTGSPVTIPAGSGTWTRLVVSGVAPATGVKAVVTLLAPGSQIGGTVWTMDDMMVTLTSLFDWFSGSSADTAQFRYDWLGATNASVSSRTTLVQETVDPLADPDCPPLPTPPTAPVIYDPCIDEVGTWRRYWETVPASVVTRWLEVVPSFRLTTKLEAAKQVRMRVYPNPTGQSSVDFDASTGWESEQIISFIPPNTTILVDGVSERVRASVGGGDWIAADQLLYGTGGAPAEWPLLDCGIAYLIAFDAPLDALATNLVTSVDLTRRY